MHIPSKSMTPQVCSTATTEARRRLAEHLAFAETLRSDPEWEKRLAKQQCRLCYYSSKRGVVAGAAMTTRDCMCCADQMTFGSTYTDALCRPCAERHGLCSHCGADLELQMRDQWPSISGANKNKDVT